MGRTLSLAWGASPANATPTAVSGLSEYQHIASSVYSLYPGIWTKVLNLDILEQHRVGSGADGEIGWHAMQTTVDTRMMIPSKLADLRDVPLAELPIPSTVTLDEERGRVMPGLRAAPAPIAAFQSAI